MPLPPRPVGFAELRMERHLSAEDAFWHACCNVPYEPSSAPLRFAGPSTGTVYFLNPENYRRRDGTSF